MILIHTDTKHTQSRSQHASTFHTWWGPPFEARQAATAEHSSQEVIQNYE